MATCESRFDDTSPSSFNLWELGYVVDWPTLSTSLGTRAQAGWPTRATLLHTHTNTLLFTPPLL